MRIVACACADTSTVSKPSAAAKLSSTVRSGAITRTVVGSVALSNEMHGWVASGTWASGAGSSHAAQSASVTP